MKTSPLSDVVSTQYAKWVYPEPIVDLPGWLAHYWQWFDPSHAHRMFWPDRDRPDDLDILIAGCGTHQAAVFAYNNPQARVVAVDVSRPSLDHHQFLKDKYGLDNLTLHQLPIENVDTLGQTFDLIVSTGVLHHMASPEAGMRALAGCLRHDGVIAIMLYAKYGRLGVYMLQDVFRELGLQQDEVSLQMVRQTLEILPSDHPIRSYMAIASDLQYDAGLVDTFLHGRDRDYTVAECIALVESGGLVFQDFFLKSPYYPPAFSSHPLHTAVEALPEVQQWSVMERIHFRNGCHFFTACRPERPVSQYKVDWLSDAALDCIPMLRHRCQLLPQSSQIARSDWTMTLDAKHWACVSLMDGQRTLAEIVQRAAQSAGVQSDEVVRLFQGLWRYDFLAMSMLRAAAR